MAGKSNKAVKHPYIKVLMANNNWKNLTDMSNATGICLTTLRSWAYCEKEPTVQSAVRLAEATGISIQEMVNKFLLLGS